MMEQDYEQLRFLSQDDGGIICPDYGQATQEAINSLGQMSKGIKLQKSDYIVRVLWSLDVAFQAGLGPL
jgi:hypothetical protein